MRVVNSISPVSRIILLYDMVSSYPDVVIDIDCYIIDNVAVHAASQALVYQFFLVRIEN